jgi:hypothetical protein
MRHQLTSEQFLSSQFIRLKHIKELQEQGLLDDTLAWRRGQHRAA